jgi:hypothetical protein
LNKKRTQEQESYPPQKQTHITKVLKKHIFRLKKESFRYLVTTQMNFVEGKESKRKRV